jgi:hypothetical protein
MKTLSPAAVVAVLALCLATGGVGYAAGSLPKNSVKSSTIRNGAVKSVDLKDGGVTGKDVDEASLVLPKQAHLLTLTADEFQPIDSDTTYGSDAEGDLVTDAAAVGEVYIAWVPVPTGATVTSIRAFVQDSTPGTEATARSVLVTPATKGYLASASVATAGSSADVQVLELPVVQPVAGSAVAIQLNLPGSSNLKLWGAQVDYTA